MVCPELRADGSPRTIQGIVSGRLMPPYGIVLPAMRTLLAATLAALALIAFAFVALLAFVVLAAHITFWGALLVFFLVPVVLAKGLEDWERHRRTRRATESSLGK
jgi:uncharacterized membrane protein